jgi:hypothetical protein
MNQDGGDEAVRPVQPERTPVGKGASGDESDESCSGRGPSDRTPEHLVRRMTTAEAARNTVRPNMPKVKTAEDRS